MEFKENLTFDDVLMVPQYSEVLPRDVDLSTRITKNIKLNIPLLSAAMDTVTESKMAVALAREGGIGIIHKNLTIAEQCAEIDKVKRSESGMILDPVTINSSKTLSDALEIMSKYHISGVPVVDKGKLKGILTNRDIRFETNLTLKVSDRMTDKNLITVKEGTTLNQAKEVLQTNRVEKLLVINDSGNLTGLITVKDILKKQNFPEAAIDKHGRLLVGAAVGIDTDTLDRVSELVNNNVDVIVIDTAHGHSKSVMDMAKSIKNKFSNLDLIVGNVATPHAVESLIDCGADAVKIGIGSGSSCTTRIVAGVGVPQLSSIINSYEIAKKRNIPIISDGGMRYSGDIAKSLAAGSNAVMLGSIFAGTDESPGEIILWEGRSYKTYRGMGSISAMKSGSSDRYFQKGTKNKKLVPEGIEGMVPVKGSLSSLVHQLLGGLRSSMGYCGAKDLEDFIKRVEFIKITSSGIVESHPHDLDVTKEAPNYRKPY
ncbi:MAG: IMP dehydrogenase [Candidatus Neomarinimicrobiota bacterium]|tara:strand:- start:12446 stop:13900 length:1455 start_codon:yes stop_codon:yes gene_type:complete